MALEILEVSPAADQEDVYIGSEITVVFGQEIDKSTITNGSFSLYLDETRVPSTVRLEEDGVTAVLQPVGNLFASRTYKVMLTGGEEHGIRSKSFEQPVADINNTSDGDVYVLGSNNDGESSIEVLITTGGTVGQAKFKWKREGASYSAVMQSMNDVYLYDDLSLQFRGTFATGDKYTIELLESIILEESFVWEFTTGSSRIETPPGVVSEPVSFLPVWNQVRDIILLQEDCNPAYGEILVDTETDEFTIRVRGELDLETVTASTVMVTTRSLVPPYNQVKVVCSVEAEYDETNNQTIITIGI